MATESQSSSRNRVFHLFPKLPTEIQAMIWSEAVAAEPQLLVLDDYVRHQLGPCVYEAGLKVQRNETTKFGKISKNTSEMVSKCFNLEIHEPLLRCAVYFNTFTDLIMLWGPISNVALGGAIRREKQMKIGRKIFKLVHLNVRYSYERIEPTEQTSPGVMRYFEELPGDNFFGDFEDFLERRKNTRGCHTFLIAEESVNRHTWLRKLLAEKIQELRELLGAINDTTDERDVKRDEPQVNRAFLCATGWFEPFNRNFKLEDEFEDGFWSYL